MKYKFLAAFTLIICTISLPFPLQAETYDIKEMTPEVKNALDARTARFGELQSLKAQGIIGENNGGLVEVRKSSPVGSGLAQEENADRMVIYQAIVNQNALGPNGLAKVQAVFAEVQREKARPGDLIQLPSGQWTQK